MLGAASFPAVAGVDNETAAETKNMIQRVMLSKGIVGRDQQGSVPNKLGEVKRTHYWHQVRGKIADIDMRARCKKRT
jgi:ABC-type hemin transport system substrate-binding protein